MIKNKKKFIFFLQKLILEKQKQSNLNDNEIIKKCYLSSDFFYRLRNQKSKNMTASTFINVCIFLEIKPEEIKNIVSKSF